MSAETKAQIQQPEPPEQGSNPTRNSPLREVFKSPMTATARGIHKAFPTITPNHISGIGLGLSLAGTEIAKRAHTKRTKALATVVLTAGALLDGVDGKLKDIITAENEANGITPEPSKTDGPVSRFFADGMKVDVTADRAAEGYMAGGRIAMAATRGNIVDAAAALTVGVTNTLPSKARADAEANGKVVQEATLGWSFLGNRVTRATTGIIGLIIPEIHGVKVQRTLDVATALSNGMSARERWQAAHDTSVPVDEKMTQELRDKAASRSKLLSKVAAGVLVYEIGTAIHEASKKRRNKSK